MKGKMIASLGEFASSTAAQGYEVGAITPKEITGVSASTVFEVPAPSGAVPARTQTLTAPAGPETAERLFAALN